MPDTPASDLNFLRDVVAPAGRGDIAAVRKLIKADPRWVHTVGSHGRTMLWESAWRGRLAVVQLLAEAGADINLPGCHYTPLGIEISPHAAASLKGHQQVADFLTAEGAAVGPHTHAYLGQLDQLKAHLQAHPNDIEAASLQVHWHGRARFEHRPCAWATPLAFALAAMQEPVARYLHGAGALLHDAMTDIVMLRAKRAPEILALFDQWKGQTTPDPDLTGRPGWPPLVYLCRGDRGGDPAGIERLLAKGVDIEARSGKGESALHVASRAGLVPAVTTLLAHDANPDATDGKGQTPLHSAIRTSIRRLERSRTVIELLLSVGANPGIMDGQGMDAAAAARRSQRDDRDEVLALLGARD